MKEGIINVLRAATMPIHKKLDHNGIGSKIRNGTFLMNDYQNWLRVTLDTQLMLQEEKARFKKSTFNKYVDYDLGISEIHKDLAELNIQAPITQVESIRLGFELKADLLIAVVYTFLGSSLGSKMIYKYVQENIPGAPTHFLNNIISHSENWNSFKEEITTHNLSIANNELASYAKQIFEKILIIQTSIV